MLRERRAKPEAHDPVRYAELFGNPAFPRAAKYDPAWFHLNHMGPNALWLAESLAKVISFEPGMRVLDLGCGTALSSIFLAREFGVRVWAADLWVPPHDNWSRVLEANVDDLVCPVHVEAHALPFAHGFFDAAVSFDAYHYFGTDVMYLPYLASFVRDGGRFGFVVPGTAREPGALPSFHSPRWWEELACAAGCVTVDDATMVPGGRDHWLRFVEGEAAWSGARVEEQPDYALLAGPRGEDLGFVRLTATTWRTD